MRVRRWQAGVLRPQSRRSRSCPATMPRRPGRI